MIKNIYIPITFDNIDDLNFDYKGKQISNEDYANMLDNYTNEMWDNLHNDWNNREDSVVLDYSKGRYVNNKELENIDTTEGSRLVECSASILDSDEGEIDDAFFLRYIENGKKCILIIDINPSTMDEDCQSEMKYWIEDSDRVLKSTKLTDNEKIKALSKTHFGINIDKVMYKLDGCKLIEMYKIKNHPYKFAILIDKIIKYNG